jgi:hypothetical protein
MQGGRTFDEPKDVWFICNRTESCKRKPAVLESHGFALRNRHLIEREKVYAGKRDHQCRRIAFVDGA